MTAAARFVEHVTQQAKLAGFDLCGVTRVWPAQSTELRHFPQWIDEGRAGEMAYLAARTEVGELKRSSLAHVAPWAKSVIVCGLNYNADAPRSIDPHPPGAGWISRYAWFGRTFGTDPSHGVDYHDAVLRRLRQVEAAVKLAQGDTLRTWCYVDTGPLVERVYAKYAGLGWMAKNTCIINEELGSFFFLGVILTSFEFAPEFPQESSTGFPPQAAVVPSLPPDRCGSCTRCIDACPTAAITPYQLDASRCISYLTIEKRGAIPEEFRAPMGRHIFGCDICQDVCPWNRGTGAESSARPTLMTTAPEFQPREELVNPALDWLAEATRSREDFNRTFKDSPIKRAKYAGVRRNVAIAMGNSGEERYRPQLERLAADEDPTIAEHAAWALQRLGKIKQTMHQK